MKLISSEAERLALMVGQILDVTRIEEGRMNTTKKPCHADEIIHSAIETHFPILNKNENSLEIRIEKNLPEIYADPMRISQVIVNLISNAVKYTQKGTIIISVKQDGNYIEICVSDTGSGISPERLPHIFERYNHSNQNEESGGGGETGTGLGLFICKFIIEAHGGEIKADSESGKGTTVTVKLPINI